MHRGYIKLYRKLEDWEWYDDLQLVGFFVHLILSANYKDSRYHGQIIPRGSLVFGRKEASKRFGVGEQVIRTMLTRLKLTNEITIKTTSKFSIICIGNFEKYQDKPTSKTTSNLTASQPATNQQLTTSKECKNIRTQEVKLGASLPYDVFLKSLQINPAYKGLDVEKELGKCQAWCLANKKVCSQRRFVNWMNRVERPMGFVATKQDRKPNKDCTACGGTGKLPDGLKCWCF